MEITKGLVERIADLARLTLSEDEKGRMCAQLEDVLNTVTSLEGLRLEEETEPMDVAGSPLGEAEQGGEER